MTQRPRLAAPALRLAPTCVAAGALLAAPTFAAAEDPNPYTLGVLETVTHDSNVFRAPSGTPIASDWIYTTGIVGTVDQPIGRERLKANAEFDYNKFGKQSQLDSTAHSVDIEGDWATVGRLSGEVGYSDSSQLYRYSLDVNTPLTARNTLDTRSGFARFHLGVVTKLTFDVALTGQQQEYSADIYRYRDQNRWAGQAGIAYQSSPDLRTSLSFRHTRGDYPHYLQALDASGALVSTPDHFTRNDVILGLSYNATGASTFNVNLSRAQEEHSVITNRSFHTWAADGRWTWTPTGRTQFSLDFLRDDDTGGEDTSFLGVPLTSTDARRRTMVSGRISYEVSAKIQLTATGAYTKRDLDTAFSELPQADVRGSDRLYQAGLGLNYLPTRNIRLGCNVSKEQRTVRGDAGSVVTYPYEDMLWSCTGQFAFN